MRPKKEQKTFVSLDLIKRTKERLVYILEHLQLYLILALRTYVRDRNHAVSVHEKCKCVSQYIKLPIAPDSLHSFLLLWTKNPSILNNSDNFKDEDLRHVFLFVCVKLDKR